MLFDSYVPPVSDSLLYFLAREINLYGTADIEDLVQEGRIKIWQLWQETQWQRNLEPRSAAYYVKAAKNRMRAVCMRKTQSFGTATRQGYSDLLNHSSDLETAPEQTEETPFELLDRVPGILLGSLVLGEA